MGTPYETFERVRQVSEANERFYTTIVGPFVRSFSNPWTAGILEKLHPMRTSRYLLSERFSPWMRGVAELARMIEKRRTPLSKDNSSIAREHAAIEQVTKTIEQARERRDAAEEQIFALLYGSKPEYRVQGEFEREERPLNGG